MSDEGNNEGSELNDQVDNIGDDAESFTDKENAETAAFAPISDTGGTPVNDSEVNLDVLLDVPVNISMEVGHIDISIRHLLQLTQGSVIELDRLAGEPMDVLVNKTLIARGEVVVVNDKFGLRLTDIITPAERVKKLK
jgi:flagellar motor switch protein FliN